MNTIGDWLVEKRRLQSPIGKDVAWTLDEMRNRFAYGVYVPAGIGTAERGGGFAEAFRELAESLGKMATTLDDATAASPRDYDRVVAATIAVHELHRAVQLKDPTERMAALEERAEPAVDAFRSLASDMDFLQLVEPDDDDARLRFVQAISYFNNDFGRHLTGYGISAADGDSLPTL
jgi:hypothetical protein